MEGKTPDKLFVSLCKRDVTHAERLKRTFATGAPMPPEAEALRREHLLYVYRLAEKGITWAGGPLGEFWGTLSIYATNSLEEAKKARQNDPMYLKGLSYDDKYFEWFIHMPLSQASPAHRDRLEGDLIEAGIIPRHTKSKVVGETPEKLFVCLYKSTPLYTQRTAETFAEGPCLPPEVEAIRREHLLYTYRLGEKGIIWAGGPFADFSGGLSIYAVNSLEEAKKVNERDPNYVAGYWHEAEYWQWLIHMPLSQASPAHRDRIRQDLVRLGIVPG